MTREEIVTVLTEVLDECSEIDISGHDLATTSWDDLGLDSLEAADVQTALAHDLDLYQSDVDVFDCASLAEVVDALLAAKA